MSYYDGLQVILLDKEEPVYRQYRDANDQLTDPTTPVVRIYNPSGSMVASATPVKESVGVYYYNVSLDSSYPEGQYQAYWEGTISGHFVTMDVPQYLWVQKIPWKMGTADEMVQSVRRMIGDTNPNNYRISTQDMYYYLADAVNDTQLEYPMGYSVTVAPTGLTFTHATRSTPTALAQSLFKIKCAEIILTGILFDVLFDGANINLGDIRINMRDTIAARKSLRKELKEEFSDLIRKIKMSQHNVGYIIDNYVYNRYGETTVHAGNIP